MSSRPLEHSRPRRPSRHNRRRIQVEATSFSWKDAESLIKSIQHFAYDGDPHLPIILEFDSKCESRGQASRDALETIRRVIIELPLEVQGLVVGVCRSSAMYLLQACEVRFAYRTAMLQFQNMARYLPPLTLSADSDIEGELETHAHVARALKRMLQHERWHVAEIFHKRMPEIEVPAIVEFMSRGAIFSAEEACRLGIIDEVVYGPPVLV